MTGWADEARNRVREAGHRAGGAREAVIDLLSGQSCCLSAQEISDQLDGAGRASVYRAIELLHGMGLVQRVDLGDGEQRYEPIQPDGEHHHHAICDTCGKVTAFEDQGLETALHRLAGHLKHSIRAHDVVIHGDCNRCVKA